MTSRICTTSIPLAGILCAAIMAIAPRTHAQAPDTTDADGAAAKETEVVEEIIVYGDKSLAQLRRELHKASEAFFEVYNDLNSTDDFDIYCEYETKLGERRRNHVCRPRFSLKAEARETVAWIMGGIQLQRSTGPGAGYNTGMGFRTPTAKRVLEKEAEMWEEMSELLTLHPELRAALEDVNRAKYSYESERQQRKND